MPCQLVVLFQRASAGITETPGETSDSVDAGYNADTTPVVSRPTPSFDTLSLDMFPHSASGPAICSSSHSSSYYERPHTISAAYDRSLSRPQVTERTFEPPAGYSFAKVQPNKSSIYATPTNIYGQTADIYARPTLCGRRFSQGAVAVAPPIVPSEYASCQQKLVINVAASVESRPATTDDKRAKLMEEAHIHRSSSLPSPVYSNVRVFHFLYFLFHKCRSILHYEFC